MVQLTPETYLQKADCMSKFFSGATTLGLTVALTLGTGTASADLTEIQSPSPGEAGFAEILSQTYGGTFSPSEFGYSNGVINAIRIGDEDDQVFPAGEYTASAKAVFAALGQSFGFVAGPEGGTYTNLFDVTGGRFNVTGDAVFTLTEPSRLARSGERGLQATSREDDNPNGEDHMVSFRIEGLPNSGHVMLLGLEDVTGFDFDFNDLVVELQSPADTATPMPATFGAGLVLLTGLVSCRRRG